MQVVLSNTWKSAWFKLWDAYGMPDKKKLENRFPLELKNYKLVESVKKSNFYLKNHQLSNNLIVFLHSTSLYTKFGSGLKLPLQASG